MCSLQQTIIRLASTASNFLFQVILSQFASTFSLRREYDDDVYAEKSFTRYLLLKTRLSVYKALETEYADSSGLLRPMGPHHHSSPTTLADKPESAGGVAAAAGGFNSPTEPSATIDADAALAAIRLSTTAEDDDSLLVLGGPDWFKNIMTSDANDNANVSIDGDVGDAATAVQTGTLPPC